jgi:hypothetical protein
MTRDDIIRMAREAGFADTQGTVHAFYQLERFAALVAAAEREACAKVCDEQEQSAALAPLEKYRAGFIAAAIRARGDNNAS